jgi:hypothetical protein
LNIDVTRPLVRAGIRDLRPARAPDAVAELEMTSKSDPQHGHVMAMTLLSQARRRWSP